MSPSFTLDHKGMDKYDKPLFELNGCKVVPATKEHAEYIGKNMRAIDVLECKCIGYTAAEAVEQGFEWDDETLCGLNPEGDPMAIMGAGFHGVSYIWLLGTDEVEKNAFTFLKLSKPIAKHLLKWHGEAQNFIHKDNLVSRRWLTFCNAEFLREVQYNKQTFYEFKLKGKHV